MNVRILEIARRELDEAIEHYNGEEPGPGPRRIGDAFQCRYSNYMKRDPLPTFPKTPAKVELKLVQIGNARKKDKRLTWEETYREAAREKEDWSDLEATVADGIEPAMA